MAVSGLWGTVGRSLPEEASDGQTGGRRRTVRRHSGGRVPLRQMSQEATPECGRG